MDEAAQQAVSLGVNATIFVIALSITISLMISVKNISEVAYEYDASLPNGSRTVAVETSNKRTIKGHELISYYANYMTDINNKEVYLSDVITPEDQPEMQNKFHVIIENSSGNRIEEINEKIQTQNFASYFRSKHIDLNKTYEVITENYNNDKQFLTIVLREIN